MERIQVFIDRLSAQQQKGDGVEKLLVTVQLLQQELLNSLPATNSSPSSKVAVVMPATFARSSASDNIIETPVRKTLFEIPESDKRFLPVEEKPVPAETVSFAQPAVEQKPPAVTESYTLRKPALASPILKEEPKEIFNLDEPAFDEFPTLMQHVNNQKELHEVIAQSKLSLNDQLKGGVAEVAHKLSEAPIKDLRKGIGVNDKFVFISELFRGDDVMYERSIKTINAFHALPEAEYWMNRELKVKLGWNDNHETVQHFYGVVRRRFS